MRDGGGEFTSYIRLAQGSRVVIEAGDLPLERPGPKRRGICLIRVSEETKASYLRASFLISFLFLLSFFKSSADMASTPWCLARSMSCWSPRTLSPDACQPLPSPSGHPLSCCSLVPDAHPRAGDTGKLDGSGETLVTLRVIVFEADLQLDRLKEISLLLVERVVE